MKPILTLLVVGAFCWSAAHADPMAPINPSSYVQPATQ